MYNGVEHPSIGPLSIAVPGELAGLEHLHKTYGKLAWEECLRPAIDLCENGWVVSEDLYEVSWLIDAERGLTAILSVVIVFALHRR